MGPYVILAMEKPKKLERLKFPMPLSLKGNVMLVIILTVRVLKILSKTGWTGLVIPVMPMRRGNF